VFVLLALLAVIAGVAWAFLMGPLKDRGRSLLGRDRGESTSPPASPR
jgi:hypothetical protein